MLLLALDTAGPDCAVALARGDIEDCKIVARRCERIGRGHAERLMPTIEAALAEAHLSFRAIEKIAVTTGPGSFTGVRVGVAAARALALALEVPAVGIGSLAAMSFSIRRHHPEGTVIAVLDARRGEVYARVHEIGTDSVILEAAALPVAELAALLHSAIPPLLLTGSAAPQLSAVLADRSTRIVGTAEAPDIGDVARLGLQLVGDALPAPLYLRGPDAKPQSGSLVAPA